MAGMSQARCTKAATYMVLMVTGLLSTACTEWGLPGKNRPLSEVRERPWRYNVYDQTPASKDLIQLEGSLWQVTGEMTDVPQRMLHPVANAAGQQLFALTWDEAPYDQLYVSGSNGKYAVVRNTR